MGKINIRRDLVLEDENIKNFIKYEMELRSLSTKNLARNLGFSDYQYSKLCTYLNNDYIKTAYKKIENYTENTKTVANINKMSLYVTEFIKCFPINTEHILRPNLKTYEGCLVAKFYYMASQTYQNRQIISAVKGLKNKTIERCVAFVIENERFNCKNTVSKDDYDTLKGIFSQFNRANLTHRGKEQNKRRLSFLSQQDLQCVLDYLQLKLNIIVVRYGSNSDL